MGKIKPHKRNMKIQNMAKKTKKKDQTMITKRRKNRDERKIAKRKKRERKKGRQKRLKRTDRCKDAIFC